MPVFGKGRTKRSLRGPLNKGLYRVTDPLRVPYSREELFRRMARGSTFENVEYFRRHGKRVFSDREAFQNERSPLPKVNRTLHVNLGHLVQRRFQVKQSPVVVVDWGCGVGTSITSLAKKSKGRVRAYGFSKDSYSAWKDNPSVKFIQETGQEFHRFFKDGSIDVLYSHYGLYHWAGVSRIHSSTLNGIERQSVRELGTYLMGLVLKLSVGGTLVANFPLPIREELNHFFAAAQHVVSYQVTGSSRKKGEFAVRIVRS